MAFDSNQYQFKAEDYAIVGVLLFLSAGFGLYMSIIKNKQSTLVEYFIAGKNVPLILVILSYFSTFAAGGMTGVAIETYAFGAQTMISVFIVTPISCCFLHFLVVPVFYRLQNISMLKYFEIRFGRTVCLLVTSANVLLMVITGSVNLYVAAIAIHQVSSLSFWVATSVMASICIIYSTLGGMRGIVVADAIQAIVMIIAVVFILIMGIIKTGHLKDIWDINSKHERLHVFNMNMDPTVRQSFWIAMFGHNFLYVCYLLMNQPLLQRCQMAPDLNFAQKTAMIGSSMTFIYIFIYQVLGLVIFAYYGGCNIIQTGTIKKMNQLVPYFAMEILHRYPTFVGIFISGILCATLSTISSLLNSISAIIMTQLMQDHPIRSDKMATLLCKALVVVLGGIMVLSLVLIDHYRNFYQAATSLTAIICGPTFAIYLIGIFFPRANHKCAAISFVVALLFGLWLIVGTLVTSFKDPTLPFANCSSTSNSNDTMTTLFGKKAAEALSTSSSVEAYFPLARMSYSYISTVVFLVNVIIFILLSIVLGPQPSTDEPSKATSTIELIPQCVQSLQLKMSRRMRRFLLCDVYSDHDETTQGLQLQEK